MPLLSTISASATRKHITSRHCCLISIIWTGEALQWFRDQGHVCRDFGLSSAWPSVGHSLPGGKGSAADGAQVFRGVGECKLLLSPSNCDLCMIFSRPEVIYHIEKKGQPFRTPDLNEVVKLGGHHGETLLRGGKNLPAL